MYVPTCVRQINEAGRVSDGVTERGAAPMQTERRGEGCLSICNPVCNPRA